jgi:hypothetical protein
MVARLLKLIKELFDDQNLELYDQAIMELKMDEKKHRGEF